MYLKKLVDLFWKVFRLVETLGKCHSDNFFHNDIHVGNILVDKNENLYLGDWGLSVSGSTSAKFCSSIRQHRNRSRSHPIYPPGRARDLDGIAVVLRGILSKITHKSQLAALQEMNSIIFCLENVTHG